MHGIYVALKTARLGEELTTNLAVIGANVEVLTYVDHNTGALPALVCAVSNLARVDLVDFLAAALMHEAL